MGEEEQRWSQPLTLQQLAELTARWLEGDGWSPWNTGSPPDSETSALIPHLVSMNRSGYVTTFSQPGVDDPLSAQRAAIDGLCAEDVADRLAGLSLNSDLVVITHYPGVEATYEIPISLDESRTFTVCAGASPPDSLWDGMHPETVREIAAAWQVTVIDPQWGREDKLWAAVTDALQRSEPLRGLIRPQ
jgi:hypothetical protein